MGGGSTSSTSQSQPLTADQRSAIFQGAMQNLSQTNPSYITGTGGTPGTPDAYSLTGPQYAAPTYQSPGTPEDLQQQMAAGYDARTQYQQDQADKTLNSNLASRGIWSSGLAQQAQQASDDSFKAQYAQNGANSANAAANLNQQNANAQNTFNLANAGQVNQSNWAPLNYLAGIWNGTGGQTSSGESSGFNFSLGH